MLFWLLDSVSNLEGLTNLYGRALLKEKNKCPQCYLCLEFWIINLGLPEGAS